MTLIERGEALRDKFRSCGRSLVTGLEPVDCREAAAVIEELLRELELQRGRTRATTRAVSTAATTDSTDSASGREDGDT